MFLPLYVVLRPCQVRTASNMVHLQLHTLPIRTNGQAPNHHHSNSSLLVQFLRISCHPEDHHHHSLQWPREALLLKCLIPPFLLSTLDSKAHLQASLHLLLLMDRTVYPHQDSLVLHHHLISQQTEVLCHLSQGHLPLTLITDSLLRPTSQGPGVLCHLSMVTMGLNLQWETNLEGLQNSIIKTIQTHLSLTWTRIQTHSIFLKTIRVPRQHTGDLQLTSMRTEEAHLLVVR